MFYWSHNCYLFEDEASSKGNADSSEVNISKATGKTFPSLVVVARPYLKTKFFHQSKVTQERTALGMCIPSLSLSHSFSLFSLC